MVSTLLLVLALIGCRSSEPSPGGPGDDDDDTSAPTTSTTPTGIADTGHTGTTPTGTVDCDLEPVVGDWTKLDIQSSEDFTIGTDGLLYGVSVSTQALIRSDHAGQTELLVPNVSSWGRGTRFLPGGSELVVADPDQGRLVTFDTTTWGSQLLKGSLTDPNGIAIDDQGFVYLTQLTGKVMRIDPATGDHTMLYDTPVSTDGITFAPDYRTLYWNSENGEIVKVVLDDDGDVIEGPTVHAVISGWSLLDGMTSDACGNLYVVQMDGKIHRVTPEGQQSVLVDLGNAPGGDFISAANFGNGFGGFEKTNLYVMSLSFGVFEIEIGIEGKWEPHWP